MHDPSKFGRAKAFMIGGTNMGFDMTDKRQVEAFQRMYNAGQTGGDVVGNTPSEDPGSNQGTAPKRSKSHKKKKRKIARSARKSQARKRKGKK